MNTTTQSYTTREQKALDVVKRHVAAFTSGNLDAVLNDFGEHSVVTTPDGVFEGLDEIRALYGSLLAEFGIIDHGDSPGLTFPEVITSQKILGTVVRRGYDARLIGM